MPADAKMLRRCCRDRQVAIKKSLCLFHSLHGDYKPTIAGKNCFLAAFLYIAVWWFGTCFIFPYIGNGKSSQLTFIFFRGIETTKQIGCLELFFRGSAGS